jgi:ribosomal protein L37AE/L43A
MAMRTSKKCPKCGKTKDVVRIMYGFPSPDMFEKSEQGKIVLGGCLVGENYAQWYCKNCNKKFGYPQDHIDTEID